MHSPLVALVSVVVSGVKAVVVLVATAVNDAAIVVVLAAVVGDAPVVVVLVAKISVAVVVARVALHA